MNNIVGILLAGGSSRRFGDKDKLIQKLPSGIPLAIASARNLQKALKQIIVIVNPENMTLNNMLKNEGLNTLVCPQSERGMGASISCGVRASTHAEGWIIALADMPYIPPSITKLISQRLSESPNTIIRPFYQGRPGHPVGFYKNFRNSLLDLDPKGGAHTILKKHANQIHQIAVQSSSVCLDFDTQQDFL